MLEIYEYLLSPLTKINFSVNIRYTKEETMKRINSSDKKKIDEYRRIEHIQIDAEINAVKRVYERIARESTPEFKRCTKRQKLLQTLSLAWHPTKDLKKKVNVKLDPTMQVQMKKSVLEQVKESLADLVCEDAKTIYNSTLNDESIEELNAFYSTAIDILSKRADELKIDIKDRLNNAIKLRLATNNVEILTNNINLGE